ncbi:UDP-N-acetylmuramoyl-L-alanine--D-glutamate ligase [Ruminococcaceae bacterium OttesenSCG-928-L11]|nr:UDP-N-acetylmuramoyl-L-alanine--D-glutamate ligase [Ruminococcaceae bacterium OttesenSCG-928-L11]
MNQTPEQFFSAIRDKRVAFIGIGVTNTDTIRLFLAQGISTLACDRRDRAQWEDTAAALEAAGAEIRAGDGYLENLDAAIVFRTPGMYFGSPEIRALRDRGVAVTSEMEMFFQLCPCRTIAITGSEGKTTTSTLIAEILKAAGHTVHLGGNIGKALLPDILTIQPTDIAVVELSSFQLLSMRPGPDISLITNITPDHLDVHRDLQEYIDAKRNIYLHQNAFSRTVLNADNATTAAFAGEVRGEAMAFSLEGPVHHGAYLKDGALWLVCRGVSERVIDAADIRLPGLHNVANYLAAIAVTAGLADKDAVHRVAVGFGGVEHRLEFVRELDGVRWYNDSIATAPVGVVAGLRAFDRKLILIGGGSDKNIPYDTMAADVIERVKLMLLSGPTGPKIADAVRAHPSYREGAPEIIMVRDIPEAVAIARQKAEPGDIVSLSPASASFDAYRNFEERGRHFKQLVLGL